MKGKTAIYHDREGNVSSARIIGMSIAFTGIILILSVIAFMFLHPEQASNVLLSAGGLFTTITVPTFAFLYKQKQTEVKFPDINPPTPEN